MIDDINITYSQESLNLEYKKLDYSFLLPRTVYEVLEIDKELQISVNHARMDLIMDEQIIPLCMKKNSFLKNLILIKKNEEKYIVDLICGINKTVPIQEEYQIIKEWCKEKQIYFSLSIRK